jgi:7,8-dihydropterin-6-yl-methyl-4-(beta-D-ribofuranosyl)aminobenzene 5'-phosphate synthase
MSTVSHLKLTVLVEDTKSNGNPYLTAKHGLSLLAEVMRDDLKLKILIDTGPPVDLALKNAYNMGIDLKNLDAIFITHGHYDHVGGLPEILKVNDHPTPVIAHPQIFHPKLMLKPKLRYVGPHFDESALKANGGIPVLSRGPVKIMDGVVTSGEIARETPFEEVSGFWTLKDGMLVEDLMLDDQALYINVEGRGLVVISGCAHAGIVNTIRQAKKMTGLDHIYAIIGGFHLSTSEDERIKKSIDEMEQTDPEAIHPCHCTGLKAIHLLSDRFKSRCRPICTGDTVKL